MGEGGRGFGWRVWSIFGKGQRVQNQKAEASAVNRAKSLALPSADANSRAVADGRCSGSWLLIG